MMLPGSEPSSSDELFKRARLLAGETLRSVAAACGRTLPADLRRHKGFVGQLLEAALGAQAGSRPGPDFPALGVELKTLPVDDAGQPLESTFVCTLALGRVGDLEWHESPVRRKLSRVLWVPVQGQRELPLSERRIGEPLLWSPNEEQESDLRHDWDELSGMVGRGRVGEVTGHLGKCLQVRPKARDGQQRRAAFVAGAGSLPELPRGFYLRASFTARIVREHYALGR